MILLFLCAISGWAETAFHPLPPEALGPSTRRTPLAISEILYHPSPDNDGSGGEFIEIYNSQAWELPLAGYQLDGGIAYRFPPASTIPAYGFVVVAQSPEALASKFGLEGVLGPFSGRLSDAGETVRLLNPAGAVLLEVPYQDRFPWPPQADGQGVALVLSRPSYHESDPRAWSAGSRPGGTPNQFEPREATRASMTPGSAPLPDTDRVIPPTQSNEVIINELMFNPISGDSSDEFIELFNRSPNPINLSGWRLADGIRFEFPNDVVIGAGDYLVIAKDLIKLRTHHPHLDTSNSIGNYRGQLSNRGERIRLLKPNPETGMTPEGKDALLVDDLRYWDRTRHSTWADGGGSSLELLHPDSDNDHPMNWRDSHESDKSEWRSVEVSGSLIARGRATARSFQIVHLGAGECLIDELSLRMPGEENEIPDGRFDTGEGRWVFQGNHVRSEVMLASDSTNGALHVRASGRGDPHSNRIRLNAPRLRFPVPGQAVFRARIRWLRGHPEILFRFQHNYFEAFHSMAIPSNLGSPGLRNSRWIQNPGPTIANVTHSPVLPQGNEPVLITATLADPDGIHHVLLQTRNDQTDARHSIEMRDDGIAPDKRAGDTIYSASLPGQESGTVIGFRVMAEDAHSMPARRIFPAAGSAREALIRFGDPEAPEGFGNYRIWYSRKTLAAWTDRNRTPASNEPLPVTFVYNGQRVFYDVRATYSGSFFNSPRYSSPTGSPCDYILRFPRNDQFLGAARVILSWPGLTGQPDPTLQREQLAYWIAGQLGLPFNHRRYVSVFVDGRRRGILMEDTQRPNGDMVRQWFPNDDQGELFKIQVRYESGHSGRGVVESQPASLASQHEADGSLRTADYRWNWAPRSDGPSANRFASLFQLVDTVNIENDRRYLESLRTEIDIEQWMRTFALENLVGNWDSYGYGNGQNMYAYKPEKSGWQLMIWDLDIGLGSSVGEGPRTPLFKLGNPFFPASNGDRRTIGRMYRTPEMVRAYYRALADAINGPFQEKVFEDLLTRRFEALSASSGRSRVGSPRSILSFVSARREFVSKKLNDLPRGFQANLSTEPIVTRDPILNITGTAPIEVHHLQFNGISEPVEWTDVTDWRLEYPLRQTLQPLIIQGVDRSGRPMDAFRSEHAIRYEGNRPLPRPQIWINEWMADNESTLSDPADGDFEDWIELYNPGREPIDLNRYTLTDNPSDPRPWPFPENTVIPAQGFLLIWADNEPDQAESFGSIHTTFRLNATGESISLRDPEGHLIDQVFFGPQAADQSHGRFPDGASSPSPDGFKPASPGQSNLPGNPLEIERVSRVGSDRLILSWPSEPGRSYQLQESSRLPDGFWRNLGEAMRSNTPSATIEISLHPDAPQRFFRILLLPPTP